MLVLLDTHRERAQQAVLNPWSFTTFKTNIHKPQLVFCLPIERRLNNGWLFIFWRDGKGSKGSFTRLLATSPRRGLGRTMLPKYSTLSRIGMLMHVGSRVTSLPGALFQNFSPSVCSLFIAVGEFIPLTLKLFTILKYIFFYNKFLSLKITH